MQGFTFYVAFTFLIYCLQLLRVYDQLFFLFWFHPCMQFIGCFSSLLNVKNLRCHFKPHLYQSACVITVCIIYGYLSKHLIHDYIATSCSLLVTRIDTMIFRISTFGEIIRRRVLDYWINQAYFQIFIRKLWKHLKRYKCDSARTAVYRTQLNLACDSNPTLIITES